MADITMLSSSPDPLLKEDQERERQESKEQGEGPSEKLVLVVEGLEGPKSRQVSLLLSSQESIRSTASAPEPPSDQSSGGEGALISPPSFLPSFPYLLLFIVCVSLYLFTSF